MGNVFVITVSHLSTHLISTRPHTMSESHPDFKAEELSQLRQANFYLEKYSLALC